MKSIETELRERVDAFVDELTDLIRASALEAVQTAIGEELSGPASRAPRRTGAKKSAATKTASRGTGKRIRRSAADVEAIGGRVLAQVKSKPGERLGSIAKALRMQTKDVRRPAFLLVEAGKLRTEGQRGGTRYFPGGAGPKPKAAKKRKTVRKKKAKKAK